jgi:hypothetical protein
VSGEPKWKQDRADWGLGYSGPVQPKKKKKKKVNGCLSTLLPLAGTTASILLKARGLL